MANVTPTRRITVRRCCGRGRRGCRPRTRASRRSPSAACTATTTIAPPTITSTRPGSSPGLWRRRAIGSVASVRNTSSAAARVSRKWWMRSLSDGVDAELDRGHRPHRARGPDRASCACARAGNRAVDVGEVVAHDRHRLAQLLGRRRIGVQELLGEAHAADVDRHQPVGLVGADDELGRAAADVDDEVRRGLRRGRRSRRGTRGAPLPRRSAARAARRARCSAGSKNSSRFVASRDALVAVVRTRATSCAAIDAVVLAQHGDRALDRVGIAAGESRSTP